MKYNIRVTSEAVSDILEGKATYLKPKAIVPWTKRFSDIFTEAGKAQSVITYDNISITRRMIEFKVGNKSVAFLDLPDNIDLAAGDTVTINLEVFV